MYYLLTNNISYEITGQTQLNYFVGLGYKILLASYDITQLQANVPGGANLTTTITLPGGQVLQLGNKPQASFNYIPILIIGGGITLLYLFSK